MLCKTKNQNSLNLLFSNDEIVTEKKAIKEDKSKENIVDHKSSFCSAKDQHISNSFFGIDNLAKSINFAQKLSKNQSNELRSSSEHLQTLAEEQKSKKLQGFNPVTSKGSSILSANAGNLTDMGGSHKQIKTPISNSIFNTNVHENSLKEIDSKTATKIEKDQIKTNRRNAENQRMDNLIEALKTTNQTKAASVNRSGTGFTENSAFKASQNNMSIFDSKDFERVPQITAGEKVSAENEEKRKYIDESWKTNGKSKKTSEIVNSLFDKLQNK